MADADALRDAFIRTNLVRQQQGKRPLRKGEFMLRSYGQLDPDSPYPGFREGRFKNEASAYQAYQQTVTGRRSGGRLPLLPAFFEKPRKRHPDERIAIQPSMYGQWKVIVHFDTTSPDGEELLDQRVSFIATTAEYSALYDREFLAVSLIPQAEEYVEERAASGSPPIEGEFEITYLEVVPVITYQSQNVYEMDFGEWYQAPQ